MKIALVAPRYAPFVGGVEMHVSQLAQRMAALGHSVEVLTQVPDATLPEVEDMNGVLVRRFKTTVKNQHYAVALSLFRFLKANIDRYDIVHSHNYHSLISLAPPFAHAPHLVLTPHFHGGSSSTFRNNLHKIYNHVGGRAVSRAESVICVSYAEATLMRSRFSLSADTLEVIPNGVDVAALTSAIPYQLDRRAILVVGRLETYKQAARVVLSMKYLRREFQLVVIGEGPQRANLHSLIVKNGLQRDVRLLGWVDDEELRRWYRTASVYVSMSTHEAYGMTLLEGVVAGAAVVASNIPAHVELLSLNAARGAALVEPDIGERELAIQIAQVADGPSGTDIERIQSWDDITARTLATYARILGEPGAASVAS